MTGTTIKLDPRTRDRLRKQAGAAGRTLREHIEHLIVAEDRRLRMDALGAAVAATDSGATTASGMGKPGADTAGFSVVSGDGDGVATAIGFGAGSAACMSEYSAETAVWESAELTDARRA